MSNKTAVIGLGNTLRRDDGIGIAVLECLLNFCQRKDIDYLNFGTTSFDLLHKIEEYDTVLIIDAINAGLNTGELKVCELKDIEYKLKDLATSTHEVSLKNIFDLSRKLKIKTKIYIAGIQIEDTSYGEGLSAALENNKENIIKEIVAFIDKNFS